MVSAYEISSRWTRLGALILTSLVIGGWLFVFTRMGAQMAVAAAVLALPMVVLGVRDLFTPYWIRFDDGVLDMPGYSLGFGRTRIPLADIVGVEHVNGLVIVTPDGAHPIFGAGYIASSRRQELKGVILDAARRAQGLEGPLDGDLVSPDGMAIGELRHDRLEIELGKNRQMWAPLAALMVAALFTMLVGPVNAGTIAVVGMALWVGHSLYASSKSSLLIVDASHVSLGGQWSEALADIVEVRIPSLEGSLVQIQIRGGATRDIRFGNGDKTGPRRLEKVLIRAIAAASAPPELPEPPQELVELTRRQEQPGRKRTRE